MDYIDPDSRDTTHDLDNMQTFYRRYNNAYVRQHQRKAHIKAWLKFLATVIVAQAIFFAAWYFVIEFGWPHK